MQHYAAQTPDGERRTGTAGEIADWLQGQDWQWGSAGRAGARHWRQAVAARVRLQTGRMIPAPLLDADDPGLFLEALAAAGLLTLERTDRERVDLTLERTERDQAHAKDDAIEQVDAHDGEI